MRISDWSSDVCSSDLKFASAWNPDRSTDRRNGQRIIRRTATQCGAEPLGADVQRVAEGGRREVSSVRPPQFSQEPGGRVVVQAGLHEEIGSGLRDDAVMMHFRCLVTI